LGGTGDEFGWPIAVDPAGNVYLTGGTQSADFPTQNPIYGANAHPPRYDVFVTKIDAAGAGLVFSTYIGRTRGDWGQGITVDDLGAVYVTGETNSEDFPTVNPIQPVCGDCATLDDDAFVVKLTPAGDAIVYSTFLGGSSYDEGDG